MFDTFFVSVQ